MEKIVNINSYQLKQYTVNRYPYLLIDKAVEIVPGEYAYGYKNVTANEWFFPGHFPDNPIMPGMLQVEALLQMLSLTVLTLDGMNGCIVKGLKADKIRLKKRVIPGFRLDIKAELSSWSNGIGTGVAEGFIDGDKVCSAELEFSVNAPL